MLKDDENSLARRNLIILILAQATVGNQMVMIFIVGGLAGQSLVSNPCFATLPISLIVLGSMLSANPLSLIMQKYGRRAGFLLGTLGGASGGIIGCIGLYLSDFSIFLIGSFLSGIYMSAQGFYRFAATDTASKGFKPKAISYVMAGGLISAIIGPQLVKLTSSSLIIPFLGTYLSVILLNLIGAFLFLYLKIPLPRPEQNKYYGSRSYAQILKTPELLVAIICAMVAYALMNLVMTSTPLAVVGCGFTESNAADIVSMHVLAMFIPSFFTGHLIVRFGNIKIITAGLLILSVSGIVALSGISLANFSIALVLLGIGWNFGFIGATSLLANSHAPEERGKIQGLNDFIVFGGVTVASLASGGLMNCAGSSAASGWNAVNFAMLPFLILAGLAILFLSQNNRTNNSI
ncbi:MAG: MFS transporter [Rhodobacterales bacterium]|nr:MFS transporter [Rhodobacterales bacterium]